MQAKGDNQSRTKTKTDIGAPGYESRFNFALKNNNLVEGLGYALLMAQRERYLIERAMAKQNAQ